MGLSRLGSYANNTYFSRDVVSVSTARCAGRHAARDRRASRRVRLDQTDLQRFRAHLPEVGYPAAFILAAFWLPLGTVFILLLSTAARDAHAGVTLI